MSTLHSTTIGFVMPFLRTDRWRNCFRVRILDDQDLDDQDLDLSVNEKLTKINGRTGLPIGNVAHTVGSQWVETETEEVNPPVLQEDSEETPEINSQKVPESQPIQESHGKEDRLARSKSKILIKNPGAITRSKSINRYNDTSSTPTDPNDVIVDKPPKN